MLVLRTQFSSVIQAAQSASTGKWKITGSMHESRSFYNATLLKNGKVLVAGGYTGSAFTATTELFNPATGSMNAYPKREQLCQDMLSKKGNSVNPNMQRAEIAQLSCG
jgi:hypothetical protein